MNLLQTYMEIPNQANPLYLNTVSGKQRFDLIVLINNFCIWYAQVLSEKNLQLTSNISSKIPRTWLGNRFLVKYIFSETGNNSLQYLQAGKVFLEVEEEQLAGRRYAIHFTITHSGDSIPLIKEIALFQPFTAQSGKNGFRLRSTNLHYARMIARILGGNIRVDNRPGFGTRYLVEIRLLSTTL
jgi:hypothetical protein